MVAAPIADPLGNRVVDMYALRLAAASVLIFGLAGCGSGQPTVMPDVAGETLDVALSEIQNAGFQDDVDIDGGGTFGIVDESNWQVCDQSPAAGETVTDTPRLTVDRECGGGGIEPSAQQSEDPSAPAPEAAADLGTGETLTAENSKELAALLKVTDYCGDAVAEFAARNQGAAIEFDGYIGAINNHDDYDTRYDLLIGAGDYSESAAPGPSFQFRDVNIVSDLGLTGSNVPEALGVGQNLHVVAQVDAYESNTCLFLLDPISTEVR